MSYYEKYLKYKEKYLQLKHKHQIGGYDCPTDVHIINEAEINLGVEGNICSVCMVNFANVKIYGCCHRVCRECVGRLDPQNCPICRAPIRDIFILNDERTHWIKTLYIPENESAFRRASRIAASERAAGIRPAIINPFAAYPRAPAPQAPFRGFFSRQ